MIICENLGRQFHGVWVLRGVSFETGSGVALGVLGPNGAGKTTLMRILTTELLPSEGRALVAGFDVVREACRVRRVIAAVPQEGRPIDFLTPYEFVASYLMLRGLSLREARRRAAEALKRFGLWDVRGREIETLSGGTKRRVLVAAVFAADAEVVFLDEPALGLDAYSRRVVWSAVSEMKRTGATVVISTHYAEEAAALSDYVVVLSRGRVAGFAPPRELVERVPGRYVVEVEGAADSIINYVTVLRIGNTKLYYVNELPQLMQHATNGARVAVRPKSLEDYMLLAAHGARQGL
jgi:ABC-2 type transport system ATP-binding protein